MKKMAVTYFPYHAEKSPEWYLAYVRKSVVKKNKNFELPHLLYMDNLGN